MIPNLVNTVKGYAEHEKATFAAVTEARAKVGQITLDSATVNSADKLALAHVSQNELSHALNKLMVVAERYPDLKANQNFSKKNAVNHRH